MGVIITWSSCPHAGSVLTGLLRNIDPALKEMKLGEPAGLEKLKEFRSKMTPAPRENAQVVTDRGLTARALARVAPARPCPPAPRPERDETELRP